MTENLFLQLDRLGRLTGLPIRCMDSGGTITLFSCGYLPGEDPLSQDPDWRAALIREVFGHTIPILSFDGETVLYGLFQGPSCFVAMGPVCLDSLENTELEAFAARHHLSQNYRLAQCPLEVFCTALALAFYLFTGIEVSETEIVIGKSADIPSFPTMRADQQKYVMSNTEHEINRLSYADEQYYLSAVREGRPEDILKGMRLDTSGKVGRFAQSTFKHYEYLACSAFTLSCRAAIEGGLDPLNAYALSDIAKQRLEHCTAINEIIDLMEHVRSDFAQKVKETRETCSLVSYVEKCKSYIDSHLNMPLHLDDIAAQIGINPSYLSRRFSQVVGVGIQKYIQQKRIQAAASMLKYSDSSIIDIVNYLYFPSQSHFGKVFKEHMGITPRKYRERESLVDSRKVNNVAKK